MESVTVKGISLTIETRLKNVRNASARLRNGVIVVTMPMHLGDERRQEIYEKLKSRMIKSIERSGATSLQGSAEVRDGQSISAMDRNFTISVKRCENRRYSSARLRGSNIEIRLAGAVGEELAGRHATVLAIKTISRALQESVEERVKELNAVHFNARISRVRIRNNSRLWGSYSMKSKNISINFKLLLAPPDVLDYVIIHELAHAKVHNHSKEFWNIVAGAMPDYMEKRRWLRKNGNTLDLTPQNPAPFGMQR